MAPWRCGQLLVWDATCPGSFAPSYRHQTTSAAGKVATAAQDTKAAKYAHLGQAYRFTSVAIETMGALGPHTACSLPEGVREEDLPGDWRSKVVCLSVAAPVSSAVQRGNAAAVMGSCSPHI